VSTLGDCYGKKEEGVLLARARKENARNSGTIVCAICNPRRWTTVPNLTYPPPPSPDDLHDERIHHPGYPPSKVLQETLLDAFVETYIRCCLLSICYHKRVWWTTQRWDHHVIQRGKHSI